MKDLGSVNSVSQVMELLQSHLERFHRYKVEDFSLETPYRFPFGIWFRGQGDAGDDLVPQIFRSDYDESSMFHHFQIRAPEHRGTYRSVFDWLCLMQHYDLPTRLLDWSESVLVALFFAVRDDENRSSEGRVYVLNARRLNRLTNWWPKHGRERASVCTPWSLSTVMRAQLAVARSLPDWRQRMKSITDMESWRTSICWEVADRSRKSLLPVLARPVAVLPSRLNGRMIFQSSCFTLHGGKRYLQRKGKAEDFLPEPVTLATLDQVQSQPDKQFLLSFTVPANVKEAIHKELLLLGIHPGSLFPEVDRQAQYIKSLWHWQPAGAPPAGPPSKPPAPSGAPRRRRGSAP